MKHEASATLPTGSNNISTVQTVQGLSRFSLGIRSSNSALEVMVKAQLFPRIFNAFFTLPQAKKPDPTSETSSLATRVGNVGNAISEDVHSDTRM